MPPRVRAKMKVDDLIVAEIRDMHATLREFKDLIEYGQSGRGQFGNGFLDQVGNMIGNVTKGAKNVLGIGDNTPLDPNEVKLKEIFEKHKISLEMLDTLDETIIKDLKNEIQISNLQDVVHNENIKRVLGVKDLESVNCAINEFRHMIQQDIDIVEIGITLDEYVIGHILWEAMIESKEKQKFIRDTLNMTPDLLENKQHFLEFCQRILLEYVK